MAEKKQYAFKSPELHWLNNYLGSSDTENRNLVAHGSSSKPSSHLSHGDGGSPTGKDTNKQEEQVVVINEGPVKIAAATAVAPIERVNIMMQCQNEMIKAGRLSTPYKGMNDCLRRTIKHEGVISLWRGNSMNVISICVREALFSAMYTKRESPLWVLPFAVILLCDYPLKYARVRLATDIKADGRWKFSLDFSRNNIGRRQFNGVIDIYKKTLRLDGVYGLYRGFYVSCAGFFLHHMADVLTSSKVRENQQKRSMRLGLIISSCTLSIWPAVFYPYVNVSQRMMMMTSGEANKYRGAMDTFYQIVKTEGVSSLFKGFTPFMIHTIAKNFIMHGYLYIVFLQLQKLAK